MTTTSTILSAAAGDTPHPLLPQWYDLIWGGLSFLLLFLLFWLYVLPRLRTALAERTQGIEVKLERAEAARAEAEALLAQYRQQLAEARSEAARIRTEAQSERGTIVEAARVEAREAAAQENERARVQIRAELTQARAELSRDVGRMAVDLAGRVVGENLADTDRTSRTVDRFLDDLQQLAPAHAGTTGEHGVR